MISIRWNHLMAINISPCFLFPMTIYPRKKVHSFPTITSLRVVLSASKIISYNSILFDGRFNRLKSIKGFQICQCIGAFVIIEARASTDSLTFPVDEYPNVFIAPSVNFRFIFLEFKPSRITIYCGFARSGR